MASNDRCGALAAGLLALACGLSVASGLSDGQLGRHDQTPVEVGFQVLLLALTGVLGGVATTVAHPSDGGGWGRRPEV